MKITLCLAVILISFISMNNFFAQSITGKGTYSISGSAEFTYSTSKPDLKTYILNFTPSFSYFIYDNLETGIMLNYQYKKQNTIFQVLPSDIIALTHAHDITKGFGIGPFITTYMYISESENKPFVGLSFLYNETITTTTYDMAYSYYYNGDIKLNGRTVHKLYSANIYAGYLLKLDKNIALAPIIQYELEGTKLSNIGDINTLLIGIQIKTFLF